MKKGYSRLLVLSVLFLGLTSIIGSSCQPKYVENETEEQFDERMEWWRDASFGMFIHWGAYAVPAGEYKGKEVPGIGEWIMERARIPISEYEEFVKAFNPTKYDAREWARIAADAGMKYLVITSKHHDGFCLWDSKVSDYDVMDASPIQRDLLKELADACKAEGVKLCFYHSILDWHHPDAKGESFAKYREEYLIPQLNELLSGDYGDIGVMWFDGEWISEWTEEQGKELYAHLRTIKPDLLVNNRVGKGRQGMMGMNKDKSFAGDFGTPEQEILEKASALDWESCMTMNNTWGFKKNDHNWKSAEMLIENLMDIIAKGGNYLLNVGPTAEGLIPGPSVERLAEMGKWIRVNEEAVYKTQRFDHYREGEGIRYIQDKKGKYVYTVCFEWPGDELSLSYVEPTEGTKITLLGYKGNLEWDYSLEKGLSIQIPKDLQDPANRPCEYAWVFKMKAQPAGVVTEPSIQIGQKTNPQTIVFFESSEFEMTVPKGAQGKYTLDGSLPSKDHGEVYTGPVQIASNATVRVRAFEEGKSPSEVIDVRFVQSKKFKATSQISQPHSNYPGQGIKGFLSYGDGIRGSLDNLKDGNWLGFEGKDMEVTIELDEAQQVSRVEAGFLQSIASWVFLPQKVEFFTGLSMTDLKKAGEISYNTPENEAGKKVVDLGVDVNKKIKYIRIKAQSLGTCPSWHQGAGSKAWVFCDEIIVSK